MLLEFVLLRLLVQVEHEVQNGLASQDLVADVSTEHDVVLILKDGSSEARPDHQPANARWVRGSLMLRALCLKPKALSQLTS